MQKTSSERTNERTFDNSTNHWVNFLLCFSECFLWQNLFPMSSGYRGRKVAFSIRIVIDQLLGRLISSSIWFRSWRSISKLFWSLISLQSLVRSFFLEIEININWLSIIQGCSSALLSSHQGNLDVHINSLSLSITRITSFR